MAFPRLIPLCFVLTALASISLATAQAGDAGIQLTTNAMEWPMAMSMYGGSEFESDDDGASNAVDGRRSLFWRTLPYISYGAMAANRIPCPVRSGRSYYTHNCFRASGPVHPYTRGCSKITHCRR